VKDYDSVVIRVSVNIVPGVPGSGFRVSGFELPVSGFGSRVSGCSFRGIQKFRGFRVLSFELRVAVFEFRVSGSGFRVAG
jgi:hypothetical protein